MATERQNYNWDLLWQEFLTDEENHSVAAFFRARKGQEVSKNWYILKNTRGWAEKKRLKLNIIINNALWEFEEEEGKKFKALMKNLASVKSQFLWEASGQLFQFLVEMRKWNVDWKGLSKWDAKNLNKLIKLLPLFGMVSTELEKHEPKKNMNVNLNIEASKEVSETVNKRIGQWDSLDSVYDDVFWVKWF